MKIVGVGAGPGMLTEEAARVIAAADLIYGSQRAIDLARARITPGCAVFVIEDYKKLSKLPQNAVVLSTGDPMLSGLGYLDGEVLPGISSLQVACARLKVSWLKIIPISVHGRRTDPDAVVEAVGLELSKGKGVFLLTDDSTDTKGLCRRLEEMGLSRDVAVMTDLGYPEERITRGRTDAPPEAPGLSCVVIAEIPPQP